MKETSGFGALFLLRFAVTGMSCTEDDTLFIFFLEMRPIELPVKAGRQHLDIGVFNRRKARRAVAFVTQLQMTYS